ncbi:Tumour necrosis factor-like domain [Plasmopara halstedii]|uniref:Tumour necrosis factor-like domain n=1 Tax=Plasmopara halstedii TaxID=4781 RepID=A0A0P1APB9_PLAHL|nr:Tumour necrosis factor-like domain [Plasmopara halstedii]CEG42929.1 Tumour necrosis factor-like domain [Plasmopara halstedii]|eukprot:XP_024579298.1 Tumour necrosis factor-like domain [Plasmopara halstedii]
MVITDYVSTANAIPTAHVADYVKCFQEALDSDFAKTNDANRSLVALDEGALRLELSATICVFHSTWKAKYTFDLDPVSVNQIDVLESKLRDQQDEIEKLKKQLKSGENPSYIKLTTSTKQGNSILCWNRAHSTEFESNGVDGVIKIRRKGVYIIGAIVNAVSNVNQKVQLMKNDNPIQVVTAGYYGGHGGSTVVNTIEQLEENDKLTITCLANLADTSYLTILRLEN